MSRIAVALLLLVILIAGCALSTSTPLPIPTYTLAPSATATATPIPPTPTPAPLRIWLDPAVPVAIRDEIAEALTLPSSTGQERHSIIIGSSAEEADLRVGLNLPITLAHWVYAVVAPFPTLADGVRWTDIERFWAGEPDALAAISNSETSPTLFVSPETLGVLHALLGPSSAKVPITVTDASDLLDAAWAARPYAWAIVPFHELEPRWKVLTVDEASVLDKQLDVEHYPLSVSIGVEGDGAAELAMAMLQDGKPLTNRATERMTVLVMTGVTALVRGIAHRMELNGILYPAEKIGTVLREADLTHISNEVPFTENCPTPDPQQKSLAFCSAPRYIELLRAVGTDVVELTGNHVKDYGSEALLSTLEILRKEGWPYFGGGENLEDARKPLVIEHNGNRFAFIGCNPVGPEYAWATADSPGAAPCDMDYLHTKIATLKAKVDVPIVTLQYWEFYQYEPTPQQQDDFRSMVDAGAVIVSGSQAHHPQAIEFYKGSFIHYGLGNLFFDQMWSLGTRQEVVDRHVIYNGRHIATELLTFMLEDYSQPRPMTKQERRALLQAVFKASGW
nr:CapA family protein [Chloroflexota bacterium]